MLIKDDKTRVHMEGFVSTINLVGIRVSPQSAFCFKNCDFRKSLQEIGTS